MAAPVSATNVVWATGYLFGKGFGGSVYDVPFGELQEVSLSDNLSLVKLMGPSSLGPISVGVGSREISGSARWAKIRSRNFAIARGGTVTASGTTTYTAGITNEPTKCDIQLKSPSDGADVTLNLYTCLIPSLDVPMTTRDFVVPNMSFECYGDGTKFYELILAGDQTES